MMFKKAFSKERRLNINLNEITINNTIYKKYINGYYVSCDGIMISVKFDDFGNLKTIVFMSSHSTKFGHKRIEIKINKKPVKVTLHRAVYKAWVGELIDGMVIEHLDGNPSNNHYSNLKQSTQKDNIMTSVLQGNFHNNRKSITVKDLHLNTAKEYDCIKDFLIDIKAPQYMIDHGGVSMLNKRTEYQNRYTITFN